MSPVQQRSLALAGAAVVVAAFVAANVHLVVTAFASQPACTARPDAPVPARHIC